MCEGVREREEEEKVSSSSRVLLLSHMSIYSTTTVGTSSPHQRPISGEAGDGEKSHPLGEKCKQDSLFLRVCEKL